MFEYMFSDGFSVDNRQFIAIHMKNIIVKVYGVSQIAEKLILQRLQNGVLNPTKNQWI